MPRAGRWTNGARDKLSPDSRQGHRFCVPAESGGARTEPSRR